MRLLVKESGLGEKYWPGIARWIGQERLRAQLQVVGVPVKPLLPIGARVTVKTKRWHRAGFGPLVPPFRTMTLMGPSPLMSTGYVLMDGTQVQHSRLAVQTDPNADRAVLELQAVENPGKPDRRFRGKQPPDPFLPQVPQPVQHPDEHLLHEAVAAGGDAGSGGADAGVEAVMDGVLDEHGNRVPFWGDDDDDDPALHALRAGGEQAHDFVHGFSSEVLGSSTKSPTKLKSTSTLSSPSKFPSSPTPLSCTWEEMEAVHDEELQEHWALKELWMKELRHVAIGEDEGRQQGQWLGVLMEDLLRREDGLEEQHRALERHRLAALVQASKDGQQEPPPTVLQTYTVPLQQVRKELDLWKQPLLDEHKSLTEITGALKVTEKELRRDPRFPQMEVAPAMLVPTVKAPHGRRRARIVICGNRIEAKNPDNQPAEEGRQDGPGGSLFANYAGGADGVLLRSMLRKAASKRWHCATVDVRTAFLLAPRREAQSRLLTMRPPKVLQEAGIVGPDEWWEVANAMYGLTSSPSNWTSYRKNVERQSMGLQWTQTATAGYTRAKPVEIFVG